MPRRRLVWLSALPLMAAGSLAAHSLAYQIVEPDAEQRAGVLASTGHGYLGYAPLALGACLALLLAALVGHATRGFRRGAPARVEWPVALVPFAGFALQEHLERLLGSGDLPLAAALEPTFLVGLALQLPFALAALLVARTLVGAAERLGRALASRPLVRTARPLDVRLGIPALLPRIPSLALGRSGRGPPA